jgi:signal peptidase I
MGAVLLLRRSLVVVTVFGRSMAPAYCDGDRVLVRRTSVSGIQCGQVVVFLRPDPDRREPRRWMIKRVAALPGDPVPRHTVPALAGRTEVVVPPDLLVLLGDNAAASYDSRQVGYFPADRLLGVAVRRLGVSGSRRDGRHSGGYWGQLPGDR